jgi:hypothetical protein
MSSPLHFFFSPAVRPLEGGGGGGGGGEGGGDGSGSDSGGGSGSSGQNSGNGDSGADGSSSEPGTSDSAPSFPQGGDNGLTGEDGGTQVNGLGPVGISTTSLSDILSDKTDAGIEDNSDGISNAFGRSPTTTGDGYRDGRQSDTSGRTSNSLPSFETPTDKWRGSIGRSVSGGGAIGIGFYLSGQLSTAVGSSGASTNSAEVFVGWYGIGFVYPTPPSPSLSFTLYSPNSLLSSDKMFSGCQPSVVIITPIFSMQITGSGDYSHYNSSSGSISISFGITAGLGEFGGVACPISLP